MPDIIHNFRSTSIGSLRYLAIWAVAVTTLCQIQGVNGYYNPLKCGVCHVSKCPELHYCEGQPIKDHCGCCTICSSSKFQPHVVISHMPEVASACDEKKCKKMEVCVENMQGLPLCECPTPYVCRRAKIREMCGTDGKTYPSRCHMKIASCNEGKIVRKKHRGPCSEEEVSYVEKRLKKNKTLRKRQKQEDLEAEELRREKRRKRKERKRRRRKSGRANNGKTRPRRHRGKNQQNVKTFEETFPDYSWNSS